MILTWDDTAIHDWANNVVLRLPVAALPIFEDVVGGRFPLTVEGDCIVAPHEGVLAEYGDGHTRNETWVFEAAHRAKEAFGGTDG